MITRYRVALNGKQLDDINDAIIIKDIQEQPPQISLNTLPSGRRIGTIVTKTSRDTMLLQVNVEINQYDITERARVIGEITSWAKKGGLLTVNYRENQQIYVECSQYPSVSSSLRWTEDITLEFTAYMKPYWESTEDSVFQSSRISTGTGTLTVNGTCENALVSASVVAGGTLNTLKLQVNNTVMEFKGLSITNGGMLQIGYDAKGVQYIKSGSTSKYSCRQINSDDDLLANAGDNTVRFEANVPVTVTLTARGIYE